MNEKINQGMKQASEAADKAYEKLPLDAINEKLKSHNININVRTNKVKYSFYGIVVLIVFLFCSMIFGGCESIPKQKSVDRMITEEQLKYDKNSEVEKVTIKKIEYENVQKISKNHYMCKAVIHRHTKVIKDFWAGKKGQIKNATIVREIEIEYVGNVIQIDFGPETTLYQD